MSQPSSDLEFDSPEFTDSLDPAMDEAAEATPVAPPAPRYRKQGFSVYTIMLVLSFLCLLAGMIIMFVEAGKYT